MSMRQDEMPSPGLIPNGPRLCQEVAKAINYTEIQRDVQGRATDTGGNLAKFFEQLLAHMKAKDLIPAADEPKAAKAKKGE